LAFLPGGFRARERPRRPRPPHRTHPIGGRDARAGSADRVRTRLFARARRRRRLGPRRRAPRAGHHHAALLRRGAALRQEGRLPPQGGRVVEAGLARHRHPPRAAHRARPARPRARPRRPGRHPVREPPRVGDRRLRLPHGALRQRADLPDAAGRADPAHPERLRDRGDLRVDRGAGREDRRRCARSAPTCAT
jgi:hypothetical protein